MQKNKTIHTPTISFTSVLVEDKENNSFTVFFKQFPDVIAEGITEEDALLNLIYALQDVLEHKSKEADVYTIPGSKVVEKMVNFTKDNNLQTA